MEGLAKASRMATPDSSGNMRSIPGDLATRDNTTAVPSPDEVCPGFDVLAY